MKIINWLKSLINKGYDKRAFTQYMIEQWYNYENVPVYINHKTFKHLKRDLAKCDAKMIYKHMSKLTYLQYLMTPVWAVVRYEAKRLAAYECNRCPVQTKLQVHHNSYAHCGLEALYMDDLEVLCETCHKKHHNK